MSRCSCEIVVTDEVVDCTIIFTSMSWNRRQSAGCSYRSRWRSGRARARTLQATRPHVGISRAIFGPDPVPSQHGVLQGAMNDMRPVMRGRWDGPSGPTVTEMYDRCRDAVTSAGARCRACPCESALPCVAGRGMPRGPAAPRARRWPASSASQSRHSCHIHTASTMDGGAERLSTFSWKRRTVG